uniref:Uncharacterized protein n=1 Tax=Trichinella nativa TaxID=6335 RepID=A0A0V1KGW2_9BILA
MSAFICYLTFSCPDPWDSRTGTEELPVLYP